MDRHYLEEQLKKDYDLLKRLEDQRRYERNPLDQGRLNADIEDIQQRIRDYEAQPELQATDQNNSLDIDALVQQVRQQRSAKIQNQCGTIWMLDISQPVALADIYTDVNILQEISSHQWREISDLLQDFKPESSDFNRLGLSKPLKRLSGLDAASQHSKLMVFGKPGAGKTTFLQWIAHKCDLGEFQANQVPIFIGLKKFAENTRTNNSQDKLLSYISEEFASCGITDKSIFETILLKGRALILLDGLDEVPEEHGKEVLKQISEFSGKYFKSQFIITCRLATKEYMTMRDGFAAVEIADFNSKQVEAFATNWFVAVARNEREEGKTAAKQFIKKLNQPEYSRIRKLAVTPILLNLACLVFQAKGEFPSKHSKLYEYGLDILLVRWDESRGIQRDEVYRYLSLEHKIDLLTQVAAITFEKNRYFFEQDEIERYIADYLRTLPNSQTDKATLRRDSKAVLKSIEVQHGLLVERARGVYSFSHLTFQEYLTAKHFVLIPRQHVLKQLIGGLRQSRWREVFLLVGEMLLHSDDLLPLKLEIDKLLASDEKLQTLLSWINKKSLSVLVPYKIVAVRAFYLGLTLPSSLSKSSFDFGLVRRLDPNLNLEFKSRDELALDFALASALQGNFNLIFTLASDHRIEFEIIQKSHDLINKINDLYQVEAVFMRRIRAKALPWQELSVIVNNYSDIRLEYIAKRIYKLTKEIEEYSNHPSVYPSELKRYITGLKGDILLCKIPRHELEDKLYNLEETIRGLEMMSQLDFVDEEQLQAPDVVNLIFDIKQCIESFKENINEYYKEIERFEKEIEFRKNNIRSSIESLLIDRDIKNNWNLSKQQIQLIQQYYEANILLSECLNNGEMSTEARQEIEDTLLLPMQKLTL